MAAHTMKLLELPIMTRKARSGQGNIANCIFYASSISFLGYMIDHLIAISNGTLDGCAGSG